MLERSPNINGTGQVEDSYINKLATNELQFLEVQVNKLKNLKQNPISTSIVGNSC